MIFILKASKQVRSRLGFTMVRHYVGLFGGFVSASRSYIYKDDEPEDSKKDFDFTFPRSGKFFECYDEEYMRDVWNKKKPKVELVINFDKDK